MKSLAEHLVAIQTKLAGEPARIDRDDNLWDAAVLVPLVHCAEGIGVLFEVRAADIGWQPGDVCFPGGKSECTDVDFAATVVRETCEELGVQASDIELLGALNYLVTHMGPIIHPYVGRLSNWQEAQYNPSEVAELFVVPLKALMATSPRTAHMQLANRAGADFPFDLLPRHPREWNRRNGYDVYFYEYQGHVIWGLTARILHGFLQRFAKELTEMLEEA